MFTKAICPRIPCPSHCRSACWLKMASWKLPTPAALCQVGQPPAPAGAREKRLHHKLHSFCSLWTEVIFSLRHFKSIHKPSTNKRSTRQFVPFYTPFVSTSMNLLDLFSPAFPAGACYTPLPRQPKCLSWQDQRRVHLNHSLAHWPQKIEINFVGTCQPIMVIHRCCKLTYIL